MITARSAETTLPKLETLSEATGALRFDRRRQARADISGVALAVFTDSNGPGKLARVTLVDSCAGGLGVHTQCAVEPGACFSLIPEQGSSLRQIGVVVRCDKTPTGFALGLRSRVVAAAA